MKHGRTISLLVLCIMAASGVAAAMGIFSGGGPGPFEHESIRGETVMIYGYGPLQAHVRRRGGPGDRAGLRDPLPGVFHCWGLPWCGPCGDPCGAGCFWQGCWGISW